jgi:GWxTD domain-containing protein
MRSVRSALTLVAGTVVLLPAAVGAQKLDDEDKKFLADVHPIMLRDEEATYRKLADKTDRLEFERIFWARRDPKGLSRNAESATPVNDFQQRYYKDLAAADDKFHFAYTRGSSSDCGRFRILLGKPDEAYYGNQPSFGLQSWASRGVAPRGASASWVYRERPGLDLGGAPGRLVIRFDAECRAEGTIAQFLERLAATKVVHRDIGYAVGKDGHLMPLADQLPKDTLSRLLLNKPRQDFAIAVQPCFLRTSDGWTALLGLVRGEAVRPALGDSGVPKMLSVTIAALASGEDGVEVGWTEQTMRVPLGPDGAFVGSFRLPLKPGSYTLKAAALEVDSARGSVATLNVEVPDFAKVEAAPDGSTLPVPSAALLLVGAVEDIAPGEDDPAHPYAAFSLGTTRLVPHFGATFHRTDPLLVFWQGYGLRTDRNGKADAAATVSILEGTSALATHRQAITTSVSGAVVGPVPLAGLEAGQYAVRLTLEDRLGHRVEAKELPFEVAP